MNSDKHELIELNAMASWQWRSISDQGIKLDGSSW